LLNAKVFQRVTSSPFLPMETTLPTLDTDRDPWLNLQRFTSARIALGRSGGSQRTTTVLDFRAAHARARDAVHAPFAASTLSDSFSAAGLSGLILTSAATDRFTYLKRPDLGRKLSAKDQLTLVNLADSPDYVAPDIVFIVSDGLAAQAAETHALPTLTALAAALHADGWIIGPTCVVPLARVKIQDEIGSLLGARFTLMLLGERPGLGAPDSLGAYFTAGPAAKRTDADRNCVSNIRPEGLPPLLAARKLAWLLNTSRQTGQSGVALKDTQPIESLSRSF
jgi:ethanolamine ammonia-lyase small subunit